MQIEVKYPILNVLAVYYGVEQLSTLMIVGSDIKFIYVSDCR